MYLNDAERANQDIYGDFKLKNPLISIVYTQIFSALQGLKSSFSELCGDIATIDSPK